MGFEAQARPGVWSRACRAAQVPLDRTVLRWPWLTNIDPSAYVDGRGRMRVGETLVLQK